MCLLLGVDRGDRLRAPGRPELGVERRDTLPDPLRDGLVGRIRQPQRDARDWMPANAEEEFELGLGDLITICDQPIQ